MKLAYLLLTALTMVMGGQLFRVLLPALFYYAVPKLDLGLGQLVAAAYLPVLAAPLAAYLSRRFAPDGVARTFGLGLLTCRLVEQVSSSPFVDTITAILGVACFWGLLALLYAPNRIEGHSGGGFFAIGLLLGWSADTLLRGLAGTLDLSWIKTGWATLVITVLGVVFAVVLWISFSQVDRAREMRNQVGLPLLGLGPLFFLQWQIFQNQGWANTLTGWPPAAALAWLLTANAAAIGAIVFVTRKPRLPGLAGTLLLGLVLVGSLLLIETPGWIFALALLASIISAGILLAILAGTSGRRSLGLVLGLALLLGTTLISLYYMSFLIPALPFLRSSLTPVAGVGLALCSLAVARQPRTVWQPTGFAPLAWAMVLVLAPLALWWADRKTVPPVQPGGHSLRVMTYNVHAGFGQDARLNVDAGTQVIASSGAEVVGLQELSRGWLISGGVDLLPLYQSRLVMPVAIMGPAADPIGGNGLFSRRELLNSGYASLPQLDGLVGRSYVWGELNWGGSESLMVIVTHLDSERRDIRLAQIKALLDNGWAGRPRTVLIGDMNAQPGTPEIDLILQAGFRDAWAESGQPERARIDWIFYTSDLRAEDVVIIESPASDHPAFAATIVPLP